MTNSLVLNMDMNTSTFQAIKLLLDLESNHP